MSENINQMDLRQLRNMVQELSDELAIMKRKYEDIIYNLDTDNFSSRFVKEQGDMKTAIKVTAEGVESKVSKKDFESTITQTAESISSIVSEFVDVSQAVEVDSPEKFTDKSQIYVIRETDDSGKVVKETFYHYNTISKDWKPISADGIIYSLFEQKEDGFYLKGDVKVAGSCILTDSLTFDSSDNPLQVEYSVDGINNWHSTFNSDSDKFMRLKIGARWSDAMKIVGSDGRPGSSGTDATVTAEKVFDVLTNRGEDQGIFSAFVNKENQLFINAEFIATNYLHLGDVSSNWEQKSVYFNNQANISTSNFFGLGQDGLTVNSNGFGIACTPNSIYLVSPNGSSFTTDRISLADYVSQYGSGSGGKAIAVFG